MENKTVKKYIVMSKFAGQDRFMLEKQFINRHSADYYANLMTEEKDYKDIEYFSNEWVERTDKAAEAIIAAQDITMYVILDYKIVDLKEDQLIKNI